MFMLLQSLATDISKGNLPTVDVSSSGNTIQTIMGIVFGIVGGLALLMITVSGLRYILSGGNPERTTKAKNGIIYALAGLAVALAAESIVYFVGSRL